MCTVIRHYLSISSPGDWIARECDDLDADYAIVICDAHPLVTSQPTSSPSNNPTMPSIIPSSQPTVVPTEPTLLPTNIPGTPTMIPSVEPTVIPTSETETPTISPTDSPTNNVYSSNSGVNINYKNSNTNDTGNTYFRYSDNIYPLSLRNMTYKTFKVPNSDSFCVTCVLDWTTIGANIVVDDCDYDFGIRRSEDGALDEIGSFYGCKSTYVIETSGTLLSWQKTYGKIEVWEVDTMDRYYLLFDFEFQWNTSQCTWKNGTSRNQCDLSNLPLNEGNTGKTAKFEIKLPKFIVIIVIHQ